MCYTFVSWDDCVCLEERLKCRANPLLAVSLDQSSCMMSPTIVILNENHKEVQKRKLDGHWKLLLSVFSQHPLTLKPKPRKFQENRFFLHLVLRHMFTLQLTILILLIPWNVTVFCNISTDNSSSTCKEKAFALFHSFTPPLSTEIKWSHTSASPISLTVSILLPPCHAEILSPRATKPLQSSPCSLGHYGDSKEISLTSLIFTGVSGPSKQMWH